MADIDIPKITKELENGNGCALKPVLDELVPAERLLAFRQLEQQYMLDKIRNPNLPNLDFYSHDSKVTVSAVSSNVYSDLYSNSSDGSSATCKDKNN